MVKSGPLNPIFGGVHLRGRSNLPFPKIIIWVKEKCNKGRGKAKFFVYGGICVGKRGKVLFRGGTKLTFCLWTDLSGIKGKVV